MKKMPRVLVVEDEPGIAELVAVNLRHNGFSPTLAFDAEAAQREADAKKQAQDSLVADWRGDFQRNASTVRHITNKIGEAAGVPEEQISELANNPAFARMMLHVSRLSSEDSIAAPAGLGDLRSPADRAEMIMTGKDPVWGDKYQNGDPEAYNTVVNLLKQAKR
jgi:CheY-like chemotaxis protein